MKCHVSTCCNCVVSTVSTTEIALSMLINSRQHASLHWIVRHSVNTSRHNENFFEALPSTPSVMAGQLAARFKTAVPPKQ